MSFYHNHKGIHIILIMITINATMAFSQSRVDLAVGVGNAVGMSERGLHLDATLYVGPQMEMHKGAIGLYGLYQFSGSSTYALQSHLLGVGFDYYILKEARRFRPFIEINATSEIASNYRDGYLQMDSWGVQSRPETYTILLGSHGSGPELTRYYSRFYVGTPIYSVIFIGLNIRIVDALNLNISGGVGLRGIQSRAYDWGGSQVVSTDVLHQLSIGTKWFRTYSAKIGLRYNFALVRKENKKQ